MPLFLSSWKRFENLFVLIKCKNKQKKTSLDWFMNLASTVLFCTLYFSGGPGKSVAGSEAISLLQQTEALQILEYSSLWAKKGITFEQSTPLWTLFKHVVALTLLYSELSSYTQMNLPIQPKGITQILGVFTMPLTEMQVLKIRV